MTTRARFLILALLFAAALPALALEVPPSPTQWFTDTAGIVPATDADLLNAKLRQFEQDSGAQFIIYIFRSLEGEAMEDFTIRAVERWKVGQKKYDNGLVLFVFFEEKKVRIEVAYGLEGTMTDAFSSRVIREFIAPAFQQGDYARGLHAAADAIIAKIKTGEEPVPPLRPQGQPQSDPQGARGEGEDIGIIPLIIILFVIFFVVLPMLRRGGCSGCLLPFFFSGGGITFGGGGGGFSGGGGGFGGFSGGGGSFGGGGASGGW